MAPSSKRSSPAAPATTSNNSWRAGRFDALRRPLFWGLTSGILLLAVAGIWLAARSAASSAPVDLHQAAYVGASKCAECHAEQVKKFAGSHHDLAMDRATPETVLGDFSDVEIEHLGVKSRMYREGDKYMISTEGPDGTIQDFEIKYVFGVE
ncbi:MAG: hypothetical protein ACTHK7_18185, partial [Aureliella sp.]